VVSVLVSEMLVPLLAATVIHVAQELSAVDPFPFVGAFETFTILLVFPFPFVVLI